MNFLQKKSSVIWRWCKTCKPIEGFEPPTYWLQVSRTTNCAISAKYPRRDSNSYACAPEPKSGVSTSSTTRALLQRRDLNSHILSDNDFWDHPVFQIPARCSTPEGNRTLKTRSRQSLNLMRLPVSPRVQKYSILFFLQAAGYIIATLFFSPFLYF